MSEIVIQHSYVPIISLLALINIFEMKVDTYNLIRQSQRPDPNISSGLGAWSAILGFFSIIAVATNVQLLTWYTYAVEYLTSLASDSSASEFKLIFSTILSVLLALFVAFEKWMIPDVPLDAEQAIERHRLIKSVLVLDATVDPDKDTPTEEPVIYINNRPIILREYEHTFKNMQSFRGINCNHLFEVVARLKRDIVDEAGKHHNVLIHDEAEARVCFPFCFFFLFLFIVILLLLLSVLLLLFL